MSYTVVHPDIGRKVFMSLVEFSEMITSTLAEEAKTPPLANSSSDITVVSFTAIALRAPGA